MLGLSRKHGFQLSRFTTRGKGIYSGAGFSGGFSFSFSSADNICSLAGESYTSGGSVGEIVILGAERSETVDEKGIYTFNIGLGLGLFAESHFFRTETILRKR